MLALLKPVAQSLCVLWAPARMMCGRKSASTQRCRWKRLQSALHFCSALMDWLPLPPLLLIYAITCALQTIGQLLFWQLAGPGVAGLLGMGGMLAWAYARRAALCVTKAEAN